MKTKIATAGVLALLVLAAPACTDLTEVPQSAITPENFYRNADEALGGTASVYAQLRQTNENYYNISEISTDEMIVPTRGGDWYDNGKWLDIHRQTFTPNSAAGLDLINNAWVDLFTGVARANVVLNGISTVNFTGKPGIVAELRTLRAFYYYLLMDAFGGVPIVTDPAIAQRPQNTRAEVFAFVEKELKESRPDLPVTWPQNMNGRITQGASRRDSCQPVSERRSIYRHREYHGPYKGHAALAGRIQLCQCSHHLGDLHALDRREYQLHRGWMRVAKEFHA